MGTVMLIRDGVILTTRQCRVASVIFFDIVLSKVSLTANLMIMGEAFCALFSMCIP